MLTWRRFLAFLSVVLLIVGSIHGYLFQRLVVGTAVPGPWKTLLAWAMIVAVISIPLSFIASRRLDRKVARFFVVPVYIWMGFIFQTFFLVLALDLLRLVGGLVLRMTGVGPIFPDAETALLAWQITSGTATGITLLASAFAIWWGLTRLAVRQVEVVLPNLPPALDGFTILHLSDLHLDLVHGREWLQRIVKRANTLGAELIAITGDLAEGSVAQFSGDAEPIRDLSAPHGVFFVTGNHEYFHDLDGWLAFLQRRGIRVLRNERVSIGNGEATFDLAGVDDHDGKRLAHDHGPELREALKGRDPERALVLLAHQPRIIQEANEEGVGLVLSGHTHGGQIWPFSYLVYLQQPYVRGLIRHGSTALYISSGTGFWGPPMRLGTTAEMAVLTLRAPERTG